ncbi:MAG: Gfo/Idh/MocA family oxidoreductase [Dehalococcoidia bacterium]
MAVGLGVIGAGPMGALHGRLVARTLDTARLVAVADLDQTLAAPLSEELGSKVYGDAGALLADPEVDAVIIATPPRTHCDLIKAAVAAGKHVFCEKPIGWELAEIDETLAQVGRSHVKLQIGFNRRFDASFGKAQKTVAAGEIGTPSSLHLIGWDPIAVRPRGREDGDIFLDTTIHDLDMARFILNSEPVSVHAQGGVMAEERLDDPDTVVTTVRFESGAVAVIDNSRLSAHGYDQRLEVFGTKGLLSVANEQPHRLSLANASGIVSAGPQPFFTERYLESYAEELRSFVACVTGDREPAVTGRDGRAAVAMAWACVRSYGESRLVAMSEIDGA